MADGTFKPIEEVEPGDRVVATDPVTGETRVEIVTAKISGEGVKHLVKVTIDTDGEEGSETAEVTATDGHPFWVPELGEWIDATDLQPGQWLQTGAGTYVQITAVERWTVQRATVHNLTVGNTHTYYVIAGDTPVLVHNCGTIDPNEVRFTQDGVGSHFKSGHSIDETAAALADGSLDVSVVDPIRLQQKPMGSVFLFEGLGGVDLEDEVASIATRQDLAEFVRRLAAVSASEEAGDWENVTLPRFLDALAAWIDAMDGYFNNQGMDVPAQPSWRLIGDMLLAATLYE